MRDPDRDPRTQPAPIDPMAYYFQDVLLLSRPDAVRLYLIRHGESGGNAARREGKLVTYDPPLTPVGEEQARRLGERMAAYGVDAIYSSPLKRSYDTGMAIAKLTGHRIEVIDDLQEINEPLRAEGTADPETAPLPEGVTHADIKRRFEQDPTWDNLPGSEPSRHFRDRIVRAIDYIVAENPGRKVAVTCHGGVIQSYVAEILGLRSDFPFYCFNASITSIRAAAGRRVLWRLNDLAHLEGMRMT
ncbi:MAG TPA: histidine phosphatase family protein [Dehalococcoidia bacterium]|jgi:probable phosphoglycerate mutase|nr:histidine phosphatase family protein [Dehalococcoidia bacterium]